MPPKVRISKDDIIKTAIDLVRTNGDDAINARAIAHALGCSTQPIFSNFDSMEQLQEEIILGSYQIYLNLISNELATNQYPQYKAFGMAYIRFAKEENQLFKLLFMRDRSGEDRSPSPDFNKSVELIMEVNDVSFEAASLIHLEMWSCVHGIATLIVTSFLPLEWDLISDMISDVYNGVVLRHKSKEKNI